MRKFAKIINNETKQVSIGTGNDIEFYKSVGMQEMEVEQAYNGAFYQKGFAPIQPEPTYIEKRLSEYPPISEQLDMIYWDKVNGTNLWQEKITEIKEKYPKE